MPSRSDETLTSICLALASEANSSALASPCRWFMGISARWNRLICEQSHLHDKQQLCKGEISRSIPTWSPGKNCTCLPDTKAAGLSIAFKRTVHSLRLLLQQRLRTHEGLRAEETVSVAEVSEEGLSRLMVPSLEVLVELRSSVLVLTLSKGDRI